MAFFSEVRDIDSIIVFTTEKISTFTYSSHEENNVHRGTKSFDHNCRSRSAFQITLELNLLSSLLLGWLRVRFASDAFCNRDVFLF